MGFSEKQREILRFPYRDYDALICDGAVRSGKTSVMSLSFFLTRELGRTSRPDPVDTPAVSGTTTPHLPPAIKTPNHASGCQDGADSRRAPLRHLSWPATSCRHDDEPPPLRGRRLPT